MGMMQKAMLNGKPQKALCANTTVFKEVNCTWGKKNNAQNNLQYIPLYLSIAAQMAVLCQSYTTIPTGWANDSFGLNLEFELHLKGVEEF